MVGAVAGVLQGRNNVSCGPLPIGLKAPSFFDQFARDCGNTDGGITVRIVGRGGPCAARQARSSAQASSNMMRTAIMSPSPLRISPAATGLRSDQVIRNNRTSPHAFPPPELLQTASWMCHRASSDRVGSEWLGREDCDGGRSKQSGSRTLGAEVRTSIMCPGFQVKVALSVIQLRRGGLCTATLRDALMRFP
jgi:hypothetical protein